MANELDSDLFPAPIHHGAADKYLVFPRNNPGITVTSTTALQTVLTDNHKRWHVFFNDRRYHNHTAHAALTLWSLGADASILKASYDDHSTYQRPSFESPGPVTQKTWKNHLGDDKYYQAYLEFFKSEEKTKSFSVLLEEYIFAPNANYISGSETHPQMLNRFLDGLLHPIIHTGLGVEFTLPGTFAEGLAQAAVHPGKPSSIIPSGWFIPSVPSLVSRFTGAVRFSDKENKADVHAFSILARLLDDAKFASEENLNGDTDDFYRDSLLKHGDSIVQYVDQWSLDGDLEKKVPELLWTNALLYAAAGLQPSGGFKADFFLMHLITSSLFVSNVFSLLKRSSQIALLRSYLAVSFGWYIAIGRPKLSIAALFNNADTANPVPPGPQPSPQEGANPSPSHPKAITPNPWPAILQSSMVHPDDHLPKLQRALSEYASHFGNTPAGTFKHTELKDADLIDGSLFLRAAGLTLNRLGWVREGQPAKSWDRINFSDSAEVVA